MNSKNYRKVPKAVLNDVKSIESDKVMVGIVLELNEKDMSTIFDGNLDVKSPKYSYYPEASTGKYCRVNIKGDVVIRKDKPKVSKTINLGERPVYGDWSKGSFTLYRDMKVYPREIIKAKLIKLSSQIIKTVEIDGKIIHVVFIRTNNLLDKNSTTFRSDLLFHMNLISENFGYSHIYDPNISKGELLGNKYIEWEILPPGEGKKALARILKGKKIPQEVLDQYEYRSKIISDLNPTNYVYGFNGTIRYFGAMFSKDCVVFENLEYGNAIYVMFEDWEKLSQKTKAQLRNSSDSDYIRIEHREGWEEQLKKVVRNHLN